MRHFVHWLELLLHETNFNTDERFLNLNNKTLYNFAASEEQNAYAPQKLETFACNDRHFNLKRKTS